MRSLTRGVAARGMLAALAALGACYRPSIASCQYACDNEACPSGLTCRAGLCVANVGDSCATGIDASDRDASDRDALTPDSLNPPGCAWGYPASNIDQCRFTGPVGDWIVTTGATFDTDSPGASRDYPLAQAIHVVLESGDQPVVVVFVHQLQVQAAATLTVTGSRPLLIYADDAAIIAGAIDFSAASSTCPSPARSANPGAPGAGGGGGGGGAGGSFGLIAQFSTVAGAVGGDGGDLGGGKGGRAGNPEIDVALVPILPGCPGAAGGTGNTATGGSGGLGGGALQISTRGALMVSGQIRASGAGGVGSTATAPGAGGGGSGGAILLEGLTVTLASGAFLCANGGGGGASGASTSGEPGHCAATTAKGAISSGGSGGDGEATEFSAVVGQPGQAGFGGGGGGGGVGVIHINGTPTLDGGASPRP